MMIINNLMKIMIYSQIETKFKLKPKHKKTKIFSKQYKTKK
jgi:hypothetical protein